MLSQADSVEIQKKFLYNYLIIAKKYIKHDATGCRILNNHTTKFIQITKRSAEKIRFNTRISTYIGSDKKRVKKPF